MTMVIDIFYRNDVVMHVIVVMCDGDGSDGHCFRIEAVIHKIDVIVMVMDIVLGFKLVMHVIDVRASVIQVIDIVIGLKL